MILYALMNNCVVHEIVVFVLYGLICNTEHYNVQRIIMILYGLVCISVYNYDIIEDICDVVFIITIIIIIDIIILRRISLKRHLETQNNHIGRHLKTMI